jgi:hypothetical protein
VSESPNTDLAENLAFFQRASQDIVGNFQEIATKTLCSLSLTGSPHTLIAGQD